MKRLMIFYVFFCILLQLSAQESEIRFKHLSVEDGLSQSTIQAIAEDRFGFIWFGSVDGLNRYDGHEFRKYYFNFDDDQSLRSNNIYAIFSDSKGKLWIGTKKGLCSYNYLTDKFETRDNWPTNSIIQIIEDNNENLILGSYKGVYVLNLNTNKITSIVTDYTRTEINRNDKLIRRKNNEILVKSYNTISRLDPGSNKLVLLQPNKPVKNISEIRSMLEDSDGRVWLGTNTGLFYISSFNNKDNIYTIHAFRKKCPEGYMADEATIMALYEDTEKKMWIGMENGGMEILNLSSLGSEKASIIRSRKIPGDPNSLTNNSIFCFHKDFQNNLWIGTFSGINYYHPALQKFKHIKYNPNSGYSSLSNNMVNSIYCYKNHILVGTEGGLDLINRNTGKIQSLYLTRTDIGNASGAVLEIIKDKDDNFWFGTWGTGVKSITGDFNKNIPTNIRLHQHPKLDFKNIFALIQTSNNKILIGTMGDGLIIYDPKTSQYTQILHNNLDETSISNNWIRDILQTKSGEIWISTYSAIDIFNQENNSVSKHFYHIDDDPKAISDNGAIVIYQDSKENIWLGTESGLNVFMPEDSSFRKFSENEGLPNNTIKGIVEDNYGNLWLSTNKGISKFVNGTNLPEQIQFINYDANDGLQSNEFNRRSAFTDDKGNLYFGGINGLTIFNQDLKAYQIPQTQVLFTDLYINNELILPGNDNSAFEKHILESNTITLQPNQTIFSIRYIALNYFAPSKIKYKYRLDGFDEKWNEVGLRRMATYTNLSPGTYIFRVQASNSDGTWSDEESTLTIMILPPWYKTTWAIIGYVIIITLIILFLRHSMRVRINLQHQLQLESLEREKVSQINKMKNRFFTNISHEFRTPLTLIITPLEKILADFNLSANLAHHLKNIHRNTKRMLRLINQLLDISRMESDHLELKVMPGEIVGFMREIALLFNYMANRKNISYSFNTNTEKFDCLFDGDKIEKILYNLISNAFKYTNDGGSIDVSFNVETNQYKSSGYFDIFVKDTGIGIDNSHLIKIFDPFYRITASETSNAPGSGIGLPLVNGLVNVYHGEIKLNSKEGQGTEFHIRLPYKKELFKSTEISYSSNYETGTTLDVYDIDTELSSEFVDQPNNINESEKSLVLIVEDNIELRKQLKEFLQETYRISEASNGKEGLESALKNLPTLVISDIKMPVKDGYNLCRDLKTNELTSHIPVILLTAKTTVDDQITGLETGADAYISKPFNVNVLQSTIKNLINVRKNLSQKFRKSIIIQPEEISITSVDEKFLKKALDLVNKNISDPEFNVDKFSREIGMSRTYLHHKLVSLTDLSPSAFIRTMRIKRAAELLTKGQLTVSEILYDVGIKSRSYFNKIFKEEFGVSPAEYLHNYKKGNITEKNNPDSIN